MSELYEAQTESGRKVVIKRLILAGQDDEFAAQGFFREAAVLGSMDHPNIVELLDAGESHENYFLVMEYIEGVTLKAFIQGLRDKGQGLALDLAFGILGQVARGLGHAHDRTMPDGSPLGVVHRDIAPENIIVTTQGVPKLIDFGIATLSGFEITSPGVIRGHSQYMSPEQARTEQISVRSDLFSLGAVLFELISREDLYQEKNETARLWKVQQGDYGDLKTRLKGEDPELIEIVCRCLAINPEERFRSARDFEKSLDKFRAARGLRVDHQTIAHAVQAIADKDTSRKESNTKGEFSHSRLVLEAENEQRPGSFSNPHLMAVTEPHRERPKPLKRIESAGLERPPSLAPPASPARLNSAFEREDKERRLMYFVGFVLVSVILASVYTLLP